MEVIRPLPRSKRLEFRWWGENDFSLARDLWSDPEVTRLIGGPFDDECIRQRLIREIANAKSHRIQYWPIFLKGNGDHVGCCGLKPYDAMKFPTHVRHALSATSDSAPHVIELGFHLRQPHWGKGYASEAGEAVVDFALASLDPAPIALFAGHHPDNEPSRNVLLKLGFTYTHDEHFPPTGLMHHGYVLKGESIRAKR